MDEWNSDDRTSIATEDELNIATARADGTMRPPVVVWGVVDGGDVYIRSVNGVDGRWYRGTGDRMQGHLSTDDVDRDVEFVTVDATGSPQLTRRIDAAYREKYHRYAGSIVDSITSPTASAATLRVLPAS
ncbi:DUF2255 family protein [Nocardia callitridis]|uniref:DUF2255 family protein n=1 Tax=Nocardia callitridis TaxID=648753 RepID=A0ABP9KUA4_9NOCA